MTFSLVGRCAETGMLGVAITTSSICVASRCPWARAGAGAVSTQNVTDPTIGPKVLDLLAGGKSANGSAPGTTLLAPSFSRGETPGACRLFPQAARRRGRE